MPKISVVTSVFNCEEYISETIESVINQTYKDWEYLLIDDCSTDRSPEIIKRFAHCDKRIIYIRNNTNKGQSANLNNGIQMASGEYIARLDHDDICEPNRFQAQLDYMESHNDTVLLGTKCKYLMGENVSDIENMSTNDSELRFLAAIGIQDMIHSSFFIRKSAMTVNNIWYRDFHYAEDYGLYTELLSVGNAHIIDEPLVKYRVFEGNTTSKTPEELRYNEMREIIERFLSSIHDISSEIVISAIEGKLYSKDDYNKLIRWINDYSNYCGVSNKGSVARFAFYNMMLWQPGSISLFFSYVKSGLNYGKKYPFCELKMLKHCLFRNKKRLLWYSGNEIYDRRR